MFGSRGPNAGGNSRGPTVAAASLHLPDQTQPHLVHTHGQEITWQVLGQAYAAVGTKQRKRRTLNARERREAAETRKVGACPACKGSHKKVSVCGRLGNSTILTFPHSAATSSVEFRQSRLNTKTF
jgi:hypothetical protein